MPLFPDIPAELADARRVHVSQRSQVFRQGDPCENYYLVLEGCIRVYARAASGKEVVLYRVEPGDICVLTTSCMLAGTPYPAEGIAESDVTAIALPKSAFDNLIATSDSFRGFVLSSFGDRLAGLVMLVEQVTLASIGQRMARFLLDRSNGVSDALVLTHQEIAAEIGSAREVVSRQLKSFETSGWVTLGRGSVRVVDTAALGRLSGDADTG
jgi:CRP/FNR family transcriptional regulator